ncbi:MAG: hypothetical protein ABI637_10285 [Gemmatimonadota bacterium]
MSAPRRPLSRTGRIVAGVLAAIWIVVGVLAVVLGVAERRPAAAVLGVAGAAYGAVWLGVARTGRYAVRPFRRTGRST